MTMAWTIPPEYRLLYLQRYEVTSGYQDCCAGLYGMATQGLRIFTQGITVSSLAC
jgi:hypothetical protein